MKLKELQEKIRANLSSVIVIILGLLLVFGGILFSLFHRHGDELNPIAGCKTNVKSYTVEAGSTDLFPVGTQLQVEMGYYNCHQGEHDDVVMIQSPNRPVPLIQTIRIAPGDTFEIEDDGQKGLYNIYVNGSKMKNSKGQKYTFNQYNVRMVQIYQNDFKKGVKKDVYFVFTDDTIGAGYDSTRFGPVTPELLVGKVLKPGEAKSEEAAPAKEEKPAEEQPKEGQSKEKAAAPSEEKTKAAEPTKEVPAKKMSEKKASVKAHAKKQQ